MLSLEQTWKPQAFYFYFLPSTRIPPHTFTILLHKIRKKTLWDPATLCCKVSATLNLGIVFPSRLLEVKYLQGTDSKLTCTETTMMQELTMFNSSVCLPVEISTIYFFTEVCAHTNSHRLKEKWEPSTSIQQWWSRNLGQVPPLADSMRQHDNSISILKLLQE